MRVPSRRGALAGPARAAVAILVILVIPAAFALAESPEFVEIQEPALDGAPLNPADVHMVARVEYDGQEHDCSDWEIWAVAPAEPVWQSPECVKGALKVHIHLGDGAFINSHEGRSQLEYDTEYTLRVRFRDDSKSGNEEDEWSDWEERPFATQSPAAEGEDADLPWKPRPGYGVEEVATDFQLPVNVAMVLNPGPHASDPLLYVTELYGLVKVVTRDGTVRDYTPESLLNFDPTGKFPGSGEMGLTGIAVDPASGDVFVSLVYEDTASSEDPKPHYAKVVRLESDERGLSAIGEMTVLGMPGEPQGPSHQISNLTISPDGHLFVHNGDGLEEPEVAQDLDSFRGKVLRMTLDGEPLTDNPFYDGEDEKGISAEDYVWAYGFRNPFGGARRLSDETHYTVENGPADDRLTRVFEGDNYRWPNELDMMYRAAYHWNPPHAPVNIEFVELQRFGGSGFPAEAMGHAFVTESGSTYATGPIYNGKRIVEFALNGNGSAVTSGPETLVEYTGTGKATAVGLAAGEDGLYFTDLYKDQDYASPIDRGANLLRVYYCGATCPDAIPSGPTSTPPSLDRIPPSISRFRSLRKVFAVGRGTAFLYSLSEPAAVWIRIRPAFRGWRIGKGTCRREPPRRGDSKHSRCVLRDPRGVLRAPGRSGPNRRPYAGRLKGRALPAGHYFARIRARDATGNLSKRRTVHFRVVSSAAGKERHRRPPAEGRFRHR